MAASPGRSVQSSQKRELEVEYVKRLRDIPVEELLGMLAYECASKITKFADEGLEFEGLLEERSSGVKYNTAVYDDTVEDYIYTPTLENLVGLSRSKGDHASAEDVRTYRSARVVIYFALKERDEDGV